MQYPQKVYVWTCVLGNHVESYILNEVIFRTFNMVKGDVPSLLVCYTLCNLMSSDEGEIHETGFYPTGIYLFVAVCINYYQIKTAKLWKRIICQLNI